VHVVPLRDAITHEVPGGLDGHDDDPGPWLTIEADGDEACPCIPSAELVPGEDGPDGWLITHHSLDGRELSEAGRG
jgi:hypothetical protein